MTSRIYEILKKREVIQVESKTGGCQGQVEVESVSKGDGVSVLQNEVLEMDGGDGCNLNVLNTTELHNLKWVKQ